METIIVYLDDAAYAQPMLHPMAQSARAADTHWVIVACAPRITHRVSKWVSNRTRENWRNKWADKLFADVLPTFEGQGLKVSARLARGPLTELVEELRAELGATPQIVDLRRPKVEAPATAQAVLPANPFTAKSKLQAGGTFPSVLASLIGLGFLLEEALL